MKLINYFRAYTKYIFCDETWDIAIRKLDNTTMPSLFSPSTVEFNYLKKDRFYWYADPSLFSYNNNLYVFFELFDRKMEIGKIAYSIYENDHFSKPVIVIDEPTHFSFPQVLFFDNEIIMIAENSEANRIPMYVATDFPTKWELKSNLVDQTKLVDAIFMKYRNRIYIIGSYVQNNFFVNRTSIFEISNDRIYEIQEIFEGNYGVTNAGNSLFYNGEYYLVSQDNRNSNYGYGLVLHKLDYDSNKCKFSSTLVRDYKSSYFTSSRRYKGVHTYNFLDGYEIVDLKRISLNNPLKIIKRLLKIIIKKYRKW